MLIIPGKKKSRRRDKVFFYLRHVSIRVQGFILIKKLPRFHPRLFLPKGLVVTLKVGRLKKNQEICLVLESLLNYFISNTILIKPMGFRRKAIHDNGNNI